MTKQRVSLKEGENMKKKYEVCDYVWGEMDLDNHKLFMMMSDGAKFDVSLYELSDDDVEGLMTVEDYDMDEKVFNRRMRFAVEREEQNLKTQALFGGFADKMGKVDDEEKENEKASIKRGIKRRD